MLCRHIKMMLPLNLNPQLNATSALRANDNIKGKGGEEQDPGFLSWGRGERLGLAVEEGERIGLCLCCLSSTAQQ
jgi:hypothetical protein